MVWQLPPRFEDALWHAAAQVLPEGALVRRRLHRAIVERSTRYTSERARLHDPSDDADLAARALFFTPTDAPKIRVAAAELASRGLLPQQLRVLDVGAGAGAMSLGLAAALPTVPMSIDALDTDRQALSLMSAAADYLARERPAPLSVSTRTADARSLEPGRGEYDLCVAGTVLNEIPEDMHGAIGRRMLEHASDNGSVIVIEPALRRTARALERLRDRMLEGGGAHVFAPCTRDAAPCPALADESDWCHEHRPAQWSRRTAELSRATGLRDDGIKFAYLVLRRSPANLVEGGPSALRIVSQPRKLKGKHECFACSKDGRERLVTLKRNKDAYRKIVRASRGDVLHDGRVVLRLRGND